jgi:endoglucanase
MTVRAVRIQLMLPTHEECRVVLSRDEENLPSVDRTRLVELTRTLCELPGPVGHEDAVQSWIGAHWRTFAEHVEVTRVNNVLAKVGGQGSRLVIMGHADEICLMVKSVTDTGHIHVWPFYGDTLGRPPRWFNPASQPCLVLTDNGTIPGFIAAASGHVVGGRNSQKEGLEWNDLFVEVGATSAAELHDMGVRPGCRVVWNTPVTHLGEHLLVGKAMDDRAALAIATMVGELLAGRDDLAFEVWLASTVQEENGLIGAASVTDAHPFDLAINLDVGLTGDIPGPDARDFPSRLGHGPILVHSDNSAHYTRALIRDLAAAADAVGAPVQHAIFQNYGSDGASLIRRGTETALVAYPTRYTHSPIETVDVRDLIATVRMIMAFATTPRLPA